MITLSWRKGPMKELGKMITILARTDMERCTYWRNLLGCDRWAIVLLTRGRQGAPPENPGPAPVRLNPKWLAKTGDGLRGEDLLYLRLSERLRAYNRGRPVTPHQAASLAVQICADLVRDGLDLTEDKRDQLA